MYQIQKRKYNIFESLKAQFGGTPPAPAPTVVVQQAAAPNPNVQQRSPATPVANPALTETDPSKVWSSLFAPVEKKEGDKNVPVPTSAWDTSSETLSDRFAGVDFTQVLNKELAEKALTGDAAALMQLMNSGMQAASMYAFKHALEASQKGVDEFGSNFKQTIPDNFRKLSIDSALASDPLLSRPELRPVVDLVVNQITAKFPNATTEDYRKGVREFLAYTAGVVSPAKPAEDTPPAQVNFKELFGLAK